MNKKDSLIINQLKDTIKYKATCDIMYFCDEGDIFTGKFIKENIPFDLSPNEPITNFFKQIKLRSKK